MDPLVTVSSYSIYEPEEGKTCQARQRVSYSRVNPIGHEAASLKCWPRVWGPWMQMIVFGTSYGLYCGGCVRQRKTKSESRAHFVVTVDFRRRYNMTESKYRGPGA